MTQNKHNRDLFFQMRISQQERAQMAEVSQRLNMPKADCVRLALSRLASEVTTQPAAQPAQQTQTGKEL